jgi:hypothetical protein
MSAYTSIGRFYADTRSPQEPADVAVIMPTILRPDLGRAVQSIYDQTYTGRIQICIGVDVAKGEIGDFDALFEARPDNVSILIVSLPYSTSVRHGGLHNAPYDGGAIRTVLGFIANSRHLAFLDDDNVYLPDHIERLRRAIEGKVWASGQRILVNQDTGEHLAIDRWDSVGPNKGRFAAQGGFIDPNCLMIDKLRVNTFLGLWAGLEDKPALVDRRFFQRIAGGSHAMVMKPTVLYGIKRTNVLWRFIQENAEF